MVAPAVAYGASGEHAGFPGTLLINHTVLADVLIELIRSARGSFSGVVLISRPRGEPPGVVAGRRAVPVRWRGGHDLDRVGAGR